MLNPTLMVGGHLSCLFMKTICAKVKNGRGNCTIILVLSKAVTYLGTSLFSTITRITLVIIKQQARKKKRLNNKANGEGVPTTSRSALTYSMHFTVTVPARDPVWTSRLDIDRFCMYVSIRIVNHNTPTGLQPGTDWKSKPELPFPLLSIAVLFSSHYHTYAGNRRLVSFSPMASRHALRIRTCLGVLYKHDWDTHAKGLTASALQNKQHIPCSGEGFEDTVVAKKITAASNFFKINNLSM